MPKSIWSSRSRSGGGGGASRHHGPSADGQQSRGRGPRATSGPGRRSSGAPGGDGFDDPTVGQAKRTRLPPSLDPSLRALLVRTAKVAALCHAAVRVYAHPSGVGGEGAGGGHYAERAAEGDRTILDEFLCGAILELEAVRDENLKALEGFLEPRIAEVRAARVAAEAEGRFPAARCLK